MCQVHPVVGCREAELRSVRCAVWWCTVWMSASDDERYCRSKMCIEGSKSGCGVLIIEIDIALVSSIRQS